MIIERIAVENFASYAQAELPLGKLGPTVSVHGATGAGKTTLLVDALTCAFFGRAYGVVAEKSKRWVLPPGQPVAKVEVEFSVGGERFLIRRVIKRDRPEEARLYRLIEGKEELLAVGSRDVERKVLELIGLDYVTFMNTILVRQGEVGKLLSAKPQERRDVFLGAFSVDFTQYRELAKEKLKESEKKISVLEEREQHLHDSIEHEAEVRQNLSEAREKLKSEMEKAAFIKKELKSVRSKLQRLRREHAGVIAKLEKYRERKEQLNQLMRQLSQLMEEREELEQKRKNSHSLRDELRKLDRQLQRLTLAEPLLVQLGETLKRIREWEKKIRELGSKARKLQSLRKSLRKAEEARQRLPEIERRLAEKEKERDGLRGRISAIEGRLEDLKKAVEILRKAQRMGSGKCPVCLRDLNVLDAKRAEEHLAEERQMQERALRSLRQAVARVEKTLKVLKSKRDEMKQRAAQTDLLKESLEEAKECRLGLAESERVLKEEERRYGQLSRRIGCLLGEVPTIEEMRARKEQIGKNLRSVRAELERLKEVPGRLRSVRRQIADTARKINALQSRLQKLAPIEARDGELRKEIRRQEELEQRVLRESERAREELGGLKQEISQLKEELCQVRKAKKEIRLVEKELEREKLLHQAYEYLYSEVFNDRGLPLALIRMVLEEVEETARHYLARFLPAFDIWVGSDEEGNVNIQVLDGREVRPLETYSGGEGALLGFVVRLAIARAMASRMKASPPACLIIDEGFGPLSQEFRQEVIRALAELSEEYRQIVVISHMEDVREHPAFSAHVRVWKDGAGRSHVEWREH